MITITGRNVNETYHKAMSLVHIVGQRQDSRAGEVLAFEEPVVTETWMPRERVLFDEDRDANPFFHFMEGLWMLAGRNDADFLNTYVKDFGERFAEEDGLIWGAYGERWRHHWSFDQLTETIERLRKDPNDRRVVISMWEPLSDFHPATPKRKDHPCNTHMYPRIVRGCLDLTICVRSNDIIWGCYGANAVHLSMVQEYLAGRIGVPVGRMFQFSNNLHVYTGVAEKHWRAGAETRKFRDYSGGSVSAMPMGSNWMHWDEDLGNFMSGSDELFANDWFKSTASKVRLSHTQFREGDLDRAIHTANSIRSTDWSVACSQWLQRRRARK